MRQALLAWMTAEFRGFDLGIDEFDSKTKLYYKESGKLRKDSHLKMKRLDLDIAWGDVTRPYSRLRLKRRGRRGGKLYSHGDGGV